MFIKFDGRLINPNAISEVVSVKQNEEYKIMVFRIDGSYMASETFSEAKAAVNRFTEIENTLIKEK